MKKKKIKNKKKIKKKEIFPLEKPIL